MEKQITKTTITNVTIRSIKPFHLIRYPSHSRLLAVYLFSSALFFSFHLPAHASAQASKAEQIIIYNNSQTLTFDAPAKKIITLAPHATELVYSAGAGEKIIATVAHSDFPEQAKNITHIGDAYRINLEKIIELKPDIIIAWASGNNSKQLLKLHTLGFKIYYSDVKNFKDIAADIKNIGRIAGTEEISENAAEQLTSKINSLRNTYSNKRKVRVFYQLWHDPLMTINKTHFINQSIKLCGGINVFSNAPVQVPQVSIESILRTKPDIMLAGYKLFAEAFNWTKNVPKALSLSTDLFIIDPDLLHRPTIRLVEGTEKLCKILDNYRKQ